MPHPLAPPTPTSTPRTKPTRRKKAKLRRRLHRAAHSLRVIHSAAGELAELLEAYGDSTDAAAARRFLLASVLSQLPHSRTVDTLRQLQNVRDLYRATAKTQTDAQRPKLSPEEMRREVRRIYGWPEEELEPTDAPTHCPNCNISLAVPNYCHHCGWTPPEPEPAPNSHAA